MNPFYSMRTAYRLAIAAFVGIAAQAGELPGWSPTSIGSGCAPCGDTAGSASEVGTILNIDLGPGESVSSVGSIMLRASEASPSVYSPRSLEFSSAEGAGIVQTSDVDVRYDAFGALRQVATPRLFIDIVADSAYQFTVRIMKKAAQGALSNGLYAYNSSSTYLLRRFVVTNPDFSPTTYNRVRVWDIASATNEWMFVYTATNSGWNVMLPGTVGSIDLVSTNHAATAWTILKRYRNSSGVVIAQTSQVFTNIGWGSVLLCETNGIGSEARTRRYSYYTTGLPFTPTTSHPAIKTVEEPDGSWRTVLTYDSAGRTLTELYGIDTGVTTTTSLCRKITYSYASLDAADDLSREPASPRKIEEYWKDTLVKRTYHIYAADYHKTIECPNPANLISDTSNLVRQEIYDWGSTRITRIVNPDGTIEVPSSSIDYYGVKTATTDVGQSDGYGSVLNGFRTEVITRATGTVESRKTWSLAAGSQGPLVSSALFSSFDDYDRAQRVDHLSGLFETFNYACCGLGTHTDTEGVSTTYGYDALGRQTTSTRLSIVHGKDYDAASRVIFEKRTGSDASLMIQKSLVYDTASFVIRDTNALSGTAYFVRTKTASSFDQITTTYPDSGTRVEISDGIGLARLTGTAVYPVRYVRGLTTTTYNGASRTFLSTQEVKLDAAGNDSAEIVTTCQDGLGRGVKTLYAGGAASYVYFNTAGQRVREVDADNVSTLFRYNGSGEREVVAIDVDQDGFADNYDGGTSGADRITKTVMSYSDTGAPGNTRGMPIKRLDTTVWTTASSAATATVSTMEASLDGFRIWRTSYKDQSTPVTTFSRTVYSGSNRYVTNTLPEGAYSVTHFVSGRLTSVTERSSTGSQITQKSYQYDTHGRRWKVTDARNGTMTISYNKADLVTNTVTPVAGGTGTAQTTTTYYDSSLRPYQEVQPDSSIVNREFYATGLLKKLYGSRTYPVQYTYDAQGRVRTMTTWQNYSGGTGAAVTTWSYDAARGWLTNKLYQGQSVGLDYTYTAGGRLKTRKWARTGTGGLRVQTTYVYGFDDGVAGNDHPDLLTITHANDPAATPQTAFTYDRRGRRLTSAFNGITTTQSYNDANLLTGESFSGGILGGRTTTFGYDNYLRRNSVGANTSTAISQSFGYDTASRLGTVTDGVFTSTYAYHSNSRLINTVTHAQSGSTRLTQTQGYDYLNRLTSIQATPSYAGQVAVGFTYGFNNANQRTNAVLASGPYWVYQYDTLGQVVSGKKYWSDGVAVAGTQYEYGFDTIGNRLSTKAGGDQNGLNLQSASYTPNLLNQYSQRTVPGAIPVTGLAAATATVTVNDFATYRKGEFYWKELSVANGSASVWQGITVKAVLGGVTNTTTGNVYVPKTPEVYGYDLDGNVTSDGRWNYTWDAENRLVRMISATLNGPQQRIDFAYDAGGRRIRKTVWNNTSGTGGAATDLAFLYDGWNVIAELNALSGNALLRSYIWGLDLSGSREGAGGVGGLLGVRNGTVVHFATYDGNGNVAALVDGSTGIYSANYEYGPFGEVIRATGPMAKANPFRFSTKYQDDETDLLYYGYRYYNASTGRWLSRDPIEENGGLNMYGFVLNNAVGGVDPDGRLTITLPWWTPHGAVAAAGGYLGFCLNRVACRRGRDLTIRLAEAQADANAPDGSTHRGAGAGPGNDADMLTHCIATCDLVRSPGLCGSPDRALAFMQEREAGNDVATQIDRLNNEAGAGIGISSQWQGQSCTTACLDALNRGLLYTIRNGAPAPSPPRP